MSDQTVESPPPVESAAHHASFFRQSGWLMIANIAGGAMMWAVHFLSKAIPESEYGSFGAYLAVIILLPTIPLQMVMAQQTAKALATGRQRELSGLIRMVWWGTTLVWLAGAVVVLVSQRSILEHWRLNSPIGLWITLLVVLFYLWMPMFWGVLQGQQNFFWLGWSMITTGVGRLAVAAAAVLVWHAYAAGLMIGVLLGAVAAVVIAAWQTRSLWLTASQSFDWRSLVHQTTPLIVGFLGFQILFTADTMFVKAYFTGEEAGFYVSAGTLSRALLWLVLPLASVMFPRLVHSAARAEKTNLMGMVLAGTAVLSILGAVSLSLLGPWVVRFVFKPSYVQVATAVLPWYVGAMVPLALANVLLNHLLARPASKLVPAVCILVLALAYLVGLTQFHGSLVTVLKVMGLCNLVLLAVCAWFTWKAEPQTRTENRA
jgi:O-antigen/teichoic acid export membrane protein